MRYDFKRIYEWPVIPKIIFIGIICLLVFYLGYFFDISNLIVRLRAAQKEELEVKSQIVSLAARRVQLNAELNKYKALTAALNNLQNQFFKANELPELLNEIIKVGKQNGLDFINFTPLKETKSKYGRVEIKASVSGSYEQIANFISQIANMPFIVEINDFMLSKGQETATGQEVPLNTNRLIAELSFAVYEVKKP